jgi:hypothetical protein
MPMYRQVHDAFETFYARMKREREQRGAEAGDAAFSDRLEGELAQFQKALERLARELRPAGRMVRRKGLAAMFT